MVKFQRTMVATTALAIALSQGTAFAQSADSAPADDTSAAAEIVVTGTRIPVAGLTSSSPVVSTGEQQIKLQAALTVEDFSTKLPQLSGGVRQGSQGSDAFGAQVLELRNFGQSLSLIHI